MRKANLAIAVLTVWRVRMPTQALPSGDLEALLQAHPEMVMGRAPSFGMGKLESMELPDAVAAVVRASPAPHAASP